MLRRPLLCRDELGGLNRRYQRAQRCDEMDKKEMDKKYGYERHVEPVERMGWLIMLYTI